jgi:hypothetical protein
MVLERRVISSFLAPWLATLGVMAGIVSRCTVDAEKASK